MTRIKQFANDMGLSYNEAKNLVNKGRRLKDGGSSTLEKFMPGKSKKDKLAKEQKNVKGQGQSSSDILGRLTRVRDSKSPTGSTLMVTGKGGDPIVRRSPDSLTNRKKKLKDKVKSLESEANRIKKIMNQKVDTSYTFKDGGTNKVKNMPKKHKLEKYLTKEEIKKIGPMGTELLLKVQEGVMKGRGKKDGGVLKELPPASENPGLRKLPTEVRNKMGYKKKGGTMKMMSGGGVARGTGAAVKGTGFKGVY